MAGPGDGVGVRLERRLRRLRTTIAASATCCSVARSTRAPPRRRSARDAGRLRRLLAEPLGGKLDAPFRLRPAIALDSGKVRSCAAGPDGARLSHDDWEKCRGGVVVDVVAEGWGQGHARASALGVAGMMAALAAAANGQAEVRAPHLVAGLRGVGAEGSLPLQSAASRFGLDGAAPTGCRTTPPK